MKAFDNLQQLWDYCQFCPVCQLPCRTVTPKVGPDDAYTVNEFQKTESQLILNCTFKFRRQKYDIVFDINCKDNSLKTQVSAPQPIGTNESPQEKAKKAFTYFRLVSDCEKCRCTHSNSSDMELYLSVGGVEDSKLDREGIYLLDYQDKYHLTLIYDRKVMLVSKCVLDETDNTVLDDNKVLELPLVKLDFSNPEKVIDKVRTLILFS